MCIAQSDADDDDHDHDGDDDEMVVPMVIFSRRLPFETQNRIYYFGVHVSVCEAVAIFRISTTRNLRL